MSGYVITRGGLFGRVTRWYHSETGRNAVVKWGPLGWLTPFAEVDLRHLKSPFEAEAKKEAAAIIAEWVP